MKATELDHETQVDTLIDEINDQLPLTRAWPREVVCVIADGCIPLHIAGDKSEATSWEAVLLTAEQTASAALDWCCVYRVMERA